MMAEWINKIWIFCLLVRKQNGESVWDSRLALFVGFYHHPRWLFGIFPSTVSNPTFWQVPYDVTLGSDAKTFPSVICDSSNKVRNQ